MVNLNSIEAVRRVMEHVQDVNNLNDEYHERKWTFLHSDGVPYVHVSDIQDHLLECTECKEEVDSKDLSIDEWNDFLKSHAEQHPNSSTQFTFKRIFDNLILTPGPGHIEMNMARLLLKLLWEPFLCEFSKLLGFRTPKAQEVVKNGTDHHRSRYILESSLESLSKELVAPFVKECKINDVVPTEDGYRTYLDTVKDESYIFLYHVTFI